MNWNQLKPLVVAAVAAGILTTGVSCGAKRTGPSAVDSNAPTEFTSTDSGLLYRVLRSSSGKKPTITDRVHVDYSGWLDDGTVFDSSYESQEPASFSMSGVVDGWTEGLQLIGEGGMIELVIPPELGYGEEGNPPNIPPAATLHFKIELHRVEA